MANGLYNIFATGIFGNIDLLNDVIRCLLIRDTSTYTFDKDHQYVSDFTSNGGVEISVASYARQTLGTKSVNQNDTNDRGEFTSAAIDFGTLESGQTVEGYIFYKQVGGDDATPANDPLICFVDTDAGGLLPAALGDANFTISPPASGWFRGSQGA